MSAAPYYPSCRRTAGRGKRFAPLLRTLCSTPLAGPQLLPDCLVSPSVVHDD